MFHTPKQIFAAVLAVTMSLHAGDAMAASVKAQQLLSLCTANMGGKGNPLEAAECMGFIVGVADTFDCIDASLLFNRSNSAKVSQPQLVSYVVGYLENHPAAKDFEAFAVVGLALAPYFPCQTKSTLPLPQPQ